MQYGEGHGVLHYSARELLNLSEAIWDRVRVHTRKPWEAVAWNFEDEPRKLKIRCQWDFAAESCRNWVKSAQERVYECFMKQSWRGGVKLTLWNSDNNINSLRCQTRTGRVWLVPCKVLVLLWSAHACTYSLLLWNSNAYSLALYIGSK